MTAKAKTEVLGTLAIAPHGADQWALISSIGENNVSRVLGVFSTFEEAERAADQYRHLYEDYFEYLAAHAKACFDSGRPVSPEDLDVKKIIARCIEGPRGAA